MSDNQWCNLILNSILLSMLEENKINTNNNNNYKMNKYIFYSYYGNGDNVTKEFYY